MEKLYNVDACHSILKRIIKFNLNENDKEELVNNLNNLGYDSIIIKEQNKRKDCVMETNIRYGVVNEKKRTAFEKMYQIHFGYDFVTFEKSAAINMCRNKHNKDYIVEKIFNTDNMINKKEEIYRSNDRYVEEGGIDN